MAAMDETAFIAASRFGFGRRAGEALPARPRDWLLDQLAGPDTAPDQGLPDTASILVKVSARLAEMKQNRAGAAMPMMPAAGAAMPAGPAMAMGDAAASGQHELAMLSRAEATGLLSQGLVTDAPFRERLVWFWANHFTVADRSLITKACAGAYVREAIRPHVTGRFADMLLAVIRHPAMISYLDQEGSTGPDSPAGLRRHKGLNENLARECLELHTVTPAAGYTQADVTNFARVLTGWSIGRDEVPGGFRFRPGLHEPGEIEVMGRVWPAGEDGGVALLGWLATHPATYRHLAQKLVCHFASDDPPPGDVARIAAVLARTQGDLGAAAASLVDLPGAWVPGRKLRSPQDYVVACLRAIGAPPAEMKNVAGYCSGLGQGAFQAPFPIGWPDRAADWAGPEAMLQRLDFAYGLAGHLHDVDPETVGHETLGPLLSATTLGQVRAAGSRRDGLALLLASPEFMRR